MIAASLNALSAGRGLAVNDCLGDPLPPGAVQRLGTTRMTYAGAPVSFCYLPGDRALVAHGTQIQILDLSRGAAVSGQSVDSVKIQGLACDSDGRLAVLITDGGEIIVRDLAEGLERRRWPSGQAGLVHVCLSPDAARILTTGRDPATLKEWDVETGRERIAISGPADSFYLQKYMQEEGGIAPADGVRVPAPVQFAMGIYGAGAATALVGDQAQSSLLHYDLATGRLLREWYPDIYPRKLALSSDGRRLLIGSRHRASEWELDGYRFLNAFTGHHGHEATAVAYAGDYGQILTGSRDGSIRRWDRVQRQVLNRWVAHQQRVAALAVSPDGDRCLSFGSGSLVESNLETGIPRLDWDRHQAPVLALAMAPAGGKAVSGSADGAIRIWDLESGRTVQTFKLPPSSLAAHALTMSPGGERLLAGGYRGISEFAMDDGRLLGELTGHEGFVRALVCMADGRRFLSSADDGSIALWSVGGQTPDARLEGHGGGVLALALSPDEKRALSGGRDGTVRLWDLETMRETGIGRGHEGWVEAVVFDRDGGRCFSAGRDGRILRWNLSPMSLQGEMAGGEWVRALALSAGGRMLASGGDDGRIRIWDPADGRLLTTRPGHVQGITRLAFTPGGQCLVSASPDNTLLVWDVSLIVKEPASP